MKHIQTFESFLNEGALNERKGWWNFDAEKIAKSFISDNGKDADAADMHNWIDMFAQDKRIEDGMPVSMLEEIIEILNKKGFKLDADEVVKEAPYVYK